MDAANFYLTASSRQQGALGIFHVYGEEAALAQKIDARVAGKTAPADAPARPLAPHELRYGWLRGGGAEAIDEVMLACPEAGQRVLMTHGGRVIREQTEGFLEQSGFSPISMDSNEFSQISDPVLDALLASCVTEGQVAAVLAAKADGGGAGWDPAHVFTQRRIVLAGAPNAGKSSLLNALAGYDRAFVDPEAGATRDVVDELVDLAGYAVWVGDMPGYGGAKTGVDAEAWRKAEQRLRLAEEVWFVVDASEGWSDASASAASAVADLLRESGSGEGDSAPGKPVLVIRNKADLPSRLPGEPWRRYFPDAPAVSVSALPDGDAVAVVEEYVAEAWKIGN